MKKAMMIVAAVVCTLVVVSSSAAKAGGPLYGVRSLGMYEQELRNKGNQHVRKFKKKHGIKQSLRRGAKKNKSQSPVYND